MLLWWECNHIPNYGVVRASNSRQNGVGIVGNINSTVKYKSLEVTGVKNDITFSDGAVSGIVTVLWADGTQGDITEYCQTNLTSHCLVPNFYE